MQSASNHEICVVSINYIKQPPAPGHPAKRGVTPTQEVLGEVGDGTGDFEDAGVAAGGEAQVIHGAFEEGAAFVIELAEALDEAARHLGIGKDGNSVEAFELKFAGPLDTVPNRVRSVSKI